MDRFPHEKSASAGARRIARKSPLPFLFFLLLTLSSSKGRPSETDFHSRQASPSGGLSRSPAFHRRSSSRIRVSCFASAFNFRLLSFSSSFFSSRFSAWRKETVLPSTLSSSCSVGTTNKAPAATYMPVTAAPCASGSSGIPRRFSGRGASSLPRASYVSRTSPSLHPYRELLMASEG